jgi:hypothetical protein
MTIFAFRKPGRTVGVCRFLASGASLCIYSLAVVELLRDGRKRMQLRSSQYVLGVRSALTSALCLPAHALALHFLDVSLPRSLFDFAAGN